MCYGQCTLRPGNVVLPGQFEPRIVINILSTYNNNNSNRILSNIKYFLYFLLTVYTPLSYNKITVYYND